MNIPVAHHDGNYYIDEKGLKELEENNQILLKYCDKDGNLVKEDTETIYETKQVLESDTLTVKSEEINIKDKYIGYKFVKTNPELIPEVIENKGVIDVYYEKLHSTKHLQLVDTIYIPYWFYQL